MLHPATHLYLLGALLSVAAFSDVRWRRIPNWTVVAVATTGFLSQTMVGGWRAAASGLAAGTSVGLLLLLLWLKRGIGGGDLKLAASTAVWVGLARLPLYLVASGLLGGALAITCYAASSAPARQAIRANVIRMHAPTLERARQAPGRTVLVPYGVAFAAGALLTLTLRTGAVP